MRRQFVSKQFTGARMGRNFFVHQRLGQCRGVLLVVSQFAEANDIKDHVFLESHAVVQSHLGGEHHGLRVIAVHVQHRRFDHLDDVGTEHTGAHVTGVRRCETDLVVDDDVHRATRGIPTCLRQCKGFLVHALASKRCVTVDQDWQHLCALWVGATVHTGTY